MATESGAATVSIVRITEENTDLLSNIADDVFDDPIAATYLNAYLNAAGHALFVACMDGQVVGHIRGVVLHQPDTASNLFIDNLGVTPDLQRRGIATQLFHALSAWAKARGATGMWVAAESDNEQAKAFYTALGLKGAEMVYYEMD